MQVHIRKYYWKTKGQQPRPGTDGFCVVLREFAELMKNMCLLFKRATAPGNFRTFEKAFLTDKAEQLAAAAVSLAEVRSEVQKFVDSPGKKDKEELVKKAESEGFTPPSAQEMADFFDLGGTPLLNYAYAIMLEHLYEQEVAKQREDRPSDAFYVSEGEAETASKKRKTNNYGKGAAKTGASAHQDADDEPASASQAE